jgi:exosortase K
MMMNEKPLRTHLAAGGTAVLVLLILYGFKRLAGSLVTGIFCVPPGYLAAWYFGIPARALPEGGLELLHTAGIVRVTEACSGFQFFVMLSGLCLWQLGLRCPAGRRLVLPLFVLPLAYGLTLLINAVRMVCSILAQQLSAAFFTADLQAVIHMLTGTLVFLPALILVYLALERKERYVET